VNYLKWGATLAALAGFGIACGLIVLTAQRSQGSTAFSLAVALDVLLVLGALNLAIAHQIQGLIARRLDAIEARIASVEKVSDTGYWKAYNDGAKDFGGGGQVVSMPRQGRS